MNPVAQKGMGLGALIGFTATFLSGSPVVGDALGLVLKSLAGGALFGAIGYFIGLLMHRSISEKLEKDVEAVVLARELRRQARQREAEEAESSKGIEDDEAGMDLDTGLLATPTEADEGPVGEPSAT